MSGYAKFMKDLVTKKRSMNCETIKMTHQVSDMVHSMAPKLEDPDVFTILCTIGSADFAKTICDLGASINLMPYSVFKILGIGKPRPTSMRFRMADRTMKRPLGIIDDVLVRVDKFIFLADFVILDCEVDYKVPIIMGRPFLATGKTLVYVEDGEFTFRVGDEKGVFHVCKSMRQPNSNEVCSFVDLVTEVIVDDTSAVINMEDTLETVLLNHDEDEKEGFVECVNALQGMGSYTYKPRKPSLDLKNWKTPPTKPSIEEPPTLEYNQILIAPKDQDKTTFTCPYGTFAFSRMPFGLCNAPAMFQRCMMSIFTDMVEEFLEVFMDDFSIVGDSFEECLDNLDKFRPYLMGTKVIVHTDHAELCYLISNKDSKSRLMRWVLLLQEFDLEIQDRKGSEYQVAGHLSRLEEEGRPHDGLEINDSFPDEQLLSISMTGMPWFADVANYLVSGIVTSEFSSNQRKKLKRDCLDYYWDEPYLFKICTDGVIRICVPEQEQLGILEACHSSPYGGHHGGARTATKVLSYGFYWPTLYKDARELIKHCDDCQRVGGISKKNEMPLTTILEIDIFDVWGIDFMGPFVSSCGNTYILVAVDYISRWVEAVALPNNEARSVVAFLKKNIFTSFSDGSEGGSQASEPSSPPATTPATTATPINLDDDDKVPDDGKGGDTIVGGLARSRKPEVWADRFHNLNVLKQFTERKGWKWFTGRLQYANEYLVKEFYANVAHIKKGTKVTKVRNLKIQFDGHALNKYIEFEEVEAVQYLEKLALGDAVRPWQAEILAIPGTTPAWLTAGAQIVIATINFEAKGWQTFSKKKKDCIPTPTSSQSISKTKG
ncbi:uncharacterized protein [Nicotiana tomentosiformis]|uniref:uncharacterized protein n=1 Tax=Nicotiana tomentosiformis TaxID=4098 RepID=UPI00388CBEAE